MLNASEPTRDPRAPAAQPHRGFTACSDRRIASAREERGDIELNVGWENWGSSASSDYQVVIDSEIVAAMGGGFGIKRNIVRHGFQDVFNARLGGSWRFPVGDNTLIARGGAAYDTAAAKPGWQSADIDGAARTTLTAGAGFRTGRFQFDAGLGIVLQGSINNPGTCNPTSTEPTMTGCNGDGVQAPLDQRQGPDPINPLVVPPAAAAGARQPGRVRVALPHGHARHVRVVLSAAIRSRARRARGRGAAARGW
jgi:hypothetical protein